MANNKCTLVWNPPSPPPRVWNSLKRTILNGAQTSPFGTLVAWTFPELSRCKMQLHPLLTCMIVLLRDCGLEWQLFLVAFVCPKNPSLHRATVCFASLQQLSVYSKEFCGRQFLRLLKLQESNNTASPKNATIYLNLHLLFKRYSPSFSGSKGNWLNAPSSFCFPPLSSKIGWESD